MKILQSHFFFLSINWQLSFLISKNNNKDVEHTSNTTWWFALRQKSRVRRAIFVIIAFWWTILVTCGWCWTATRIGSWIKGKCGRVWPWSRWWTAHKMLMHLSQCQWISITQFLGHQYCIIRLWLVNWFNQALTTGQYLFLIIKKKQKR